MKITLNTYTSHQAQITYLLMFYLSIENNPKFTTNDVGVIAITEDCANFHKYMYLCLKKSVIPHPKKKNIGYLRLRLQKSNSIQTKKRRKTVLHPKTFSLKNIILSDFKIK